MNSKKPMASAHAHASEPSTGMHEQFLLVSEKAYGECATTPKLEKPGSSTETSVLTIEFARRAAMKALYTLSGTSFSSSFWLIENFIIWLQVRNFCCGFCFTHSPGRTRNSRLSDSWSLFSMTPSQMLSYPLSVSSQLLWGSTMLAMPFKALSVLAINSVPSGQAVYFLLLGWTIALLASFVWLAIALSSENGVLPWSIKV